jgi:hypothetical protein
MHKQDMSSYIQRKYSPWLRSYARTVVRNIVHDYIKASRTICFLTCCTNYQYPRRIRCMHALLIKPSMSALNHNVLTAERNALNPKRDFLQPKPLHYQSMPHLPRLSLKPPQRAPFPKQSTAGARARHGLRVRPTSVSKILHSHPVFVCTRVETLDRKEVAFGSRTGFSLFAGYWPI